MQLHQIATSQSDESFIIKYRDIGCFCGDLRGQCACFSTKSHSVVIDLGNISKSFEFCPPTTENVTEHFEDLSQNVKGNNELETEKSLDDITKEVTNDPKIEAAHESSLNFPSEIFEGLINDEPFDLNSIDINHLTFTFEENDDKLHRGKLGTENSWQLTTFENQQASTSSYAEKGLLGNDGAGLIATSTCLSDFNKMSVNLSTEKEASNINLSAHGSHCFVDPKNVLFVKTPQVGQPQKLSTGTKTVAKKVEMIIKDTKVPASTLATNQLSEKSGAEKAQSKAISKKPRIVPKINFLECHKCFSSMLTQKGKCISCKNWFCYDCMAEPNCLNYVCESCLESED
ncbi:uncharacterized protein LOC124644166 [Helicoverpa zea]|uniref:uncharacterized protein LOC124644166 n=1 Tax=Helicoverpa zea TaxID=7113 RepID=UPI001F5A2FBD|nr:uncharacterized protein LOC124644166 [Helicoverpa zea]